MKYSLLLLLSLAGTAAAAAPPSRILPPPAREIDAGQKAALEEELARVTTAFEEVKGRKHAADAHIFIKAVRYALDFGEWYDKKPEDGIAKARTQLAEAARRIEGLKAGKTPWLEGPGSKVLGFYSRIDDSPQPYGVDVPEGLEWGKGRKKVPVWLWLHGRGDTATDLHFIASRMKSKGGEFKPGNALVVHPFGRYCNGYKSAGETDVLECKTEVLKRFHGDGDRVALMGFSMGGAGAWHLGAHYADQWACVHTGAGFVDVKRYQKLSPDQMPPWYVQSLWGVYDVPAAARNFFNVPLIAYSGENDAQRDSAEYMTEVLAGQGYQLQHLIGPGMGHKYHPEVRDQVAAIVEKAVAAGKTVMPRKVTLQFRSARYPRMHWIQVVQVVKPMEDTRIDAEVDEKDGTLKIQTHNVRSFEMMVPWSSPGPRRTVIINGGASTFEESRPFTPGPGKGQYYLATREAKGAWRFTTSDGRNRNTMKPGGTCIEDAFLDRFVIVLPDKPGRHPATDAWIKEESGRFIQRWRMLMRGDPLVVHASQVGSDRATEENLILWGDDLSNACIAQRVADLPLKWEGDDVVIGTVRRSSASHVPLMIHPDVPASPAHRLIVLNSGLTFREAHDRTNSQQNPKLPDWAILNIASPPDNERAGEVVAADFFDSNWQLKH